MNNDKIIVGISRFSNIGGITCYINSILHILQQVPIFADYIYSEHFVESLKQNFPQEHLMKQTTSYELHRLFIASINNDNSSITPTTFKNIIGTKNSMWNERNHQDSQEFLSFLIATLEEETGSKVKFVPNISDNNHYLSQNFLASLAWAQFQHNEYSLLKNIFDGMFNIQLKCICCSNISNNYEPFTTLQVAIPTKNSMEMFKEFSIENCLEHLCSNEKLDRRNMYNCNMCGVKNRGFKQTSLWRTPKLLVIHIKRFGFQTQKLVNKITYPLYDLNIGDYIHDESPDKFNSLYDLIGVNLHQDFGGINAGHYTSLVKNRFDNNWYLFNDAREPIQIKKKEDLQNKDAYLLFYYKK